VSPPESAVIRITAVTGRMLGLPQFDGHHRCWARGLAVKSHALKLQHVDTQKWLPQRLTASHVRTVTTTALISQNSRLSPSPKAVAAERCDQRAALTPRSARLICQMAQGVPAGTRAATPKHTSGAA
jgi:hypothetical protein